MKTTTIRTSTTALASLLLLAASPAVMAQEKPDMAAESATAGELTKLIAVIRPVGESSVKGSVVFEKTPAGVTVTANVGGLEPESKHGIHIHEFGDLGSPDATSAGGHFNPEGHPHALPPESDRHAGDLGNLEADDNGNATMTLTVDNITLDSGKSGILGRAVIVHAKPDDGGQPTGNAGDRIGAGIIGISRDGVRKTGETEADPAEVSRPSTRPAGE